MDGVLTHGIGTVAIGQVGGHRTQSIEAVVAPAIATTSSTPGIKPNAPTGLAVTGCEIPWL